jgi:hypothetical protein
MSTIQGRITEYGFNWGAAKVTRGFSDDRKGWVTILLDTPKGAGIQVYVTKTGKVRVHDRNGEWKAPKPSKKAPPARREPKTGQPATPGH